jgi:hypothetical protein
MQKGRDENSFSMLCLQWWWFCPSFFYSRDAKSCNEVGRETTTKQGS